MRIPTVQELGKFYKRQSASRAMRVIKLLLVIVALGFMAWGVVAGVRELQAQSATLDLQLMAIGLIFVLIASLLGSAVWYSITRAFGMAGAWRQTVVIHMASNAAKYVPGYGWHYISKGYFLGEHTAYKQGIFLIIVSELVLLLSSGAVLGLAATYSGSLPVLGWTISPVLLAAMMVLVLVATIGWGSYVYKQFAAANGEQASAPTTRMRVLIWCTTAWLLAGIGWLAFAAATWLFVMALDSTAATTYGQSIMALTFSSIVSLLVIFIPAGLGIREATMAALLAPSLPIALGVTTSILLRLAVIVCELLQLGLVLVWSKHWPRGLKNMLSTDGERENTPNEVL